MERTSASLGDRPVQREVAHAGHDAEHVDDARLLGRRDHKNLPNPNLEDPKRRGEPEGLARPGLSEIGRRSGLGCGFVFFFCAPLAGRLDAEQVRERWHAVARDSGELLGHLCGARRAEP